jgi:hypothetical protein
MTVFLSMMVFSAISLTVLHLMFCSTKSRMMKISIVLIYITIFVIISLKLGEPETLQENIKGGFILIGTLFIADIIILLIRARP